MKKFIMLLFISIGLMLGGCTSSEPEKVENTTLEESAERESRPDYFELQYRDRHKDRQRHHWAD